MWSANPAGDANHIGEYRIAALEKIWIKLKLTVEHVPSISIDLDLGACWYKRIDRLQHGDSYIDVL